MGAALVILIIALVLGVGLGIFIARNQARKQASQRAVREAAVAGAEGPGRLRALKLGDVVGLDGALWSIDGTLRFDEDGFLWQEHLLSEGERRLWLSVEDDEDGLSLIRWERAPAGHGLSPDGDRVTHEGADYALEERGRASYTGAGTTGTPASGTMEYADYRAGERLLGFERYTREGSWELSLGTEISEGLVDVYPGGGPEPPR